MANLLGLFGEHILSPGAFEVLKTIVEQATRKSWEDLFLDSFGDAVDRQQLHKVLRHDLNINVATTTFSTLTSDEFAAALARAMAAKGVLEAGDDMLGIEDYHQLMRNAVSEAQVRFREAVLGSEEAINRALLDGTLATEALAREGVAREQVTQDLVRKVLDYIETLKADARPPSETDTLAAAQQRLAELPLDMIPDPAPPPRGSHLPQGFMRNDLFVGREADLLAIAKALKGGMTTVIGQSAAVTGMGGVGKTQLANEFVHRYGQYFDGGVFWLSFANADAVPAEIAACGSAEKLHMPPGFSSLPLDEQVQRVLDAWQSPMPRLLIFDNCEDESLLRKWRRPGGCRVLVTSRRAQWAPALGVRALALGELKHMESVRLLCNYRPDLSMDDADLHAIAHELGNLPLALHLASSYLRRYQRTETPTAYLHHLRSPALLEHHSMIGWQLKQELSPTKHEEHVVRTFTISYDQLKVDDPIDVLARGLLARAAHFAPGEPIPHELLLATIDRAKDNVDAMHDAEDALARLVNLGLLEEEAEGALHLHRLVAAFVRAVTNDAEAQEAVEDAMLRGAYYVQLHNPAWLLVLQPHLLAISGTAQVRNDERAASLCNALGHHLNMMGDFLRAQHYYTLTLIIRQQVWGTEHPNTVSALSNLGTALYAQGKLEAAQHYFERALVILEQDHEIVHLDKGLLLNNLGMLRHTQGDHVKAQSYYEQALATDEAAYGLNTLEVAADLTNLGTLQHHLGDLKGALERLSRALEIREQILAPTHPDIAQSLNNIGGVLQEVGYYTEARYYFERALAILEATTPDHPHTAICRANLEAIDAGTLIVRVDVSAIAEDMLTPQSLFPQIRYAKCEEDYSNGTTGGGNGDADVG